VVFECVRAAVADTDWHGKLLSTINDLHTCADGIGPLVYQTIPETAILVLLCRFQQSLEGVWGACICALSHKAPAKTLVPRGRLRIDHTCA
jgi:hypothetical protein